MLIFILMKSQSSTNPQSKPHHQDDERATSARSATQRGPTDKAEYAEEIDLTEDDERALDAAWAKLRQEKEHK
jgi:hypothetical protein